MTPEQKAILLSMLKVDLGILSTSVYDERFGAILDAAREQITDMGATLDLDDAMDQQLVVMFAAWLWRRRDSQAAMGDGLRRLLTGRILREKARGPVQSAEAGGQVTPSDPAAVPDSGKDDGGGTADDTEGG